MSVRNSTATPKYLGWFIPSGAFSINHDYTVMVWINHVSLSNFAIFDIGAGPLGTGGADDPLDVLEHTSTEGMVVYCTNPAVVFDTAAVDTAIWVANRWHHVALVRTGNSLSGYLDGKWMVTDTGSFGARADCAAFTLGYNSNARFASLKFYQRAMTGAEIVHESRALYPISRRELVEAWPIRTHKALTGCYRGWLLDNDGTAPTADIDPPILERGIWARRQLDVPSIAAVSRRRWQSLTSLGVG